jgi:hypothetical protein
MQGFYISFAKVAWLFVNGGVRMVKKKLPGVRLVSVRRILFGGRE